MIPRILLGAGAALLCLTAAKDDPFAGRIAGKPVNCVQLQPSSGPTILDDKTIIYQPVGRRIWRTTPRGRCPLDPSATLVLFAYGSQICRNDRFRVLQPGNSIPSNICLFDRFVPYVKP